LNSIELKFRPDPVSPTPADRNLYCMDKIFAEELMHFGNKETVWLWIVSL